METNEKYEVALLLADGFEEVEATSVIVFVRHSGISLVTVSVTGNHRVVGAHGVPFTADALLNEVDFSSIQMLVMPGGIPGADNLSKSKDVNRIVKQFYDQGKWIAAICAAPLVLGKLGLLKGKRITCYPGFESYMEGAEIIGENSVVDGKLITANGPASGMYFGYNIVAQLRDEKTAREMANGMMVNYF
ncbi:MAG: DJ-1/PfpI family protein [Bacteroidaceae bacterium]|nr:DJ-1/PfpI family protein [Bacteroidaceae bacterium]